MTNTQELGLLLQAVKESQQALLDFVKEKYPLGSILVFKGEFGGSNKGKVLSHFGNGILVSLDGKHKKNVSVDTIEYDRIIDNPHTCEK